MSLHQHPICLLTNSFCPSLPQSIILLSTIARNEWFSKILYRENFHIERPKVTENGNWQGGQTAAKSRVDTWNLSRWLFTC